MKRHAVSVAVVVIVVAVWGGAAWAASSNTSSGGPVQILSAALSPAPANVAIVNNGCSGNNQRTNLGMAWTDAQSSTLDAAGGYLVTGYAIGRASSSGGTYALAGATSGSPPATVFADAPTVANTPVALVADSGNGAKVVYPVAESTLTVGPSLTIGATGTQVNAIQVSPDGLTAIIAEYTADQVQILTWSGTAWAITKTLAVSNPTAVTISPVANSSGAYVAYVVSDPGTTANSSVYPVVLTGATTTLGSPITVQRQANPTAMTVTANGAWLYVANYNSASVSAVNLATSAVTNISLPGTTPNPIAIASTQDSSHVYVADRRNSTIADIAVASNTVSANIALTAGGLNDAQLTGAGNPNILAMSPSGTALYVAEFGAAQVQVVSTALAATPDTVAASVSTGAGSEPIELAMTPNGCTVYAADWPSDKIFAIATATNAVTTAFTATCETQDPQPMQVTPDNQYLIVPENYRCGDIQILNTSTNAVTTLTGVGNTPAMIAIPPVPVWYRLSATHSQWSSNPSTPTSYPVGWNPGSWR